MKRIAVLGGGGFIGGHLITKLKSLGHWVRGADIKKDEFKQSDADEGNAQGKYLDNNEMVPACKRMAFSRARLIERLKLELDLTVICVHYGEKKICCV